VSAGKAGGRAVEEEDKYGDAQQRRSYRDAMERLGEDVVRMRLANRMSITDRAEDNPPPAFANVWLDEKGPRSHEG
jgi:hypothetical protein